MTSLNKNKIELSKKLKERAILETLQSTVHIPGSSHLKLRNDARDGYLKTTMVI